MRRDQMDNTTGCSMNKYPALGDCPVCGVRWALSRDLVQGELLECDNCGTELEVISLGPVELKETPEAEEAWED